MKKYLISAIACLSCFLLTSCSESKKEVATISANKNSMYTQTFNDLNLGTLFEFDFYLPNADKRWVNLWVESYENGKKNTHNLTQLSYGKSLDEIKKGRIGFGIINSDQNTHQVFLYAPDVNSLPKNKENNFATITSWDYAIEETQLQLGKTYLLAVYRQTNKDSMRTYNLQDEEDIKQMIQDDTNLYLLKIKIEAMKD